MSSSHDLFSPLTRRSDRILPNFIVIGAMKAGTTSLWGYLAMHPQIELSDTKELDFFVADRNWNKGVEWYSSHFHSTEETTAVGEASPSYTNHPRFDGVPARMSRVIPEARLIYCLRHPVERMRSEYLHWALERDPRVLRDQTLMTFEEYVDHDPQVVLNSSYAMQTDRFLEFFPREQILLVLSEELKRRREATLRRIFSFLGADPRWWHRDLMSEWHVTSYKRPISNWALRLYPVYKPISRWLPKWTRAAARDLGRKGPRADALDRAFRKHLESLVRSDVRDLRRLLGDAFDGWGLT